MKKYNYNLIKENDLLTFEFKDESLIDCIGKDLINLSMKNYDQLYEAGRVITIKGISFTMDEIEGVRYRGTLQ